MSDTSGPEDSGRPASAPVVDQRFDWPFHDLHAKVATDAVHLELGKLGTYPRDEGTKPVIYLEIGERTIG